MKWYKNKKVAQLTIFLLLIILYITLIFSPHVPLTMKDPSLKYKDEKVTATVVGKKVVRHYEDIADGAPNRPAQYIVILSYNNKLYPIDSPDLYSSISLNTPISVYLHTEYDKNNKVKEQCMYLNIISS